MHTEICDKLGIEFPIFAFTHCRDVVAAVTNAGGIGVLGATGFTPEQLEVELTWIDEATGGKPYGLDLLLPPKYVGAEEGGIDAKRARSLLPQEHLAFVDDLLARYGIAAPTDPPRNSPAGGLNISPKGYEPLVEVAFAHNIRLIASALGSPPVDLVERAHDHDVLVAALAGKTEHARRHAAAGVDLIVAQGTEAGGHTGEVATMVLVPEVVDAVAPVPVLAAGGIARGRQIAAALALGAEGINMGTRFCATVEAPIHDNVKQAYIDNDERGTNLIFRSLHNTARVGKFSSDRTIHEYAREIWKLPQVPF